MSLLLDVNKVKEVLLSDGWHLIADNSLDFDAYEFVYDEHVIYNDRHGAPSTGFMFTDPNGTVISGPASSIQAIKF